MESIDVLVAPVVPSFTALLFPLLRVSGESIRCVVLGFVGSLMF